MACVAFRLFLRRVSPSSWPFLACVAYKLFSRRVLPSGCFHGVCRFQVVFTAGLFMVFSAPSLVFVVYVTFSLVFGISCSYLFSMSFLPFGIVFHGVLLLLSSRAARHVGLVFHIFYTLRSVFFFSLCVLLCISCSWSRFYSRSLLLTFSSPQLVPVFGNFRLYFFVCSSMLQKLKHKFFLVYFLGLFCFLVFYSLGIFKRC